MFSNFKDAFINKPQFTTKVPESVLKALSMDLPEGFKYINDHDGICRIDYEGAMCLGNYMLQMPIEAKPIFEKLAKPTVKDVIAYAYNSQTKIEILPDSDGYFTINNEKISIDKLIINPFKDLELSDGKLYIIPPPFPDPFPIEVTGNGFSLTLMLQRQAINSVTNVKIGTVSDSAFNISYIFDQTIVNGNTTFNMTLQPSSSASDVLASIEIFNAFIYGKGTLCGEFIQPFKDNSVNLIPDEVINVWRQIVDIEKELNVNFDATREMTFDDIKKIKELYRCFVEKIPFKTYLSKNTLSGVGEFKNSAIEIGKEIFFEYSEKVEYELLGTNIVYYQFVAIFDGEISEFQVPEEGTSGDFFVTLCSTKGKRMYSSTQYYLNEKLLEDFKNEPNHIEILKSAKELE